VPTGKLADKINESFGSFDEFKKQMSATTISQFGSGWGWLVADAAGKLKVVKTGTPRCDDPGLKPLLTIDVWEHATTSITRTARRLRERGDRQALNWEFAAATSQ